MLPILEKSADYLLPLVKPDLSLPMIGDADRDALSERKSDVSVCEGMNNSTDAIDLNEIRAFFRVMAEETGRQDFRWLATGRAEGTPPQETNSCLADPGFYVLRDGWGPQDSYLLLTGTNLERGENSAHSHFDAGHLELQVRGADVLVDTGRYIYGNCGWPEWRRCFRSTQAHNTVLVDGHEMGSVPDTSPQVRGVRIWRHRFETGPEMDVIELSHNGYAFLPEPVFHLRRVVHVKPEVWLVDDLLTGEGEHDYRLFFNFAPGRLTPQEGVCFGYANGEVGVRLLPLLADGLSASVLEGSEQPIGGWVSYGYYRRVPAPQVTYAKRGPAPARFLTAIVDEAYPADVVVEREEGGALVVVVRGERGEQRVQLGP